MLSPTYLHRLGVAKVNQVRMMRDRGHTISALDAAVLAQEADPMQVINHFAAMALTHGCSLAEVLGGTYMPGDVTTQQQQGCPPQATTVVFLDLQWDDPKRRSKMSSTDQVKSALDAARAAVLTPAAKAQVAASVEAAHASAVPNVLLVSPTPLTPDAKREIIDVGNIAEGGSEARASESVRVQVMLLSELHVPLVEHVLTPRHQRLTLQECAAFFKEKNIHASQLGTMPDNDAVASYYDYREGDVIRVVRAGSVEYRVVHRDMS